MRIIEKKISLEPMTSRLPSVWPSYKDDVLYYFDKESLKEREWQYTSNWGMIPMNIVIAPNPSSVTSYDETIPLNERKNYASAYTLSDDCTHCYGGEFETNNGCSTSGESSYDEMCDFTLSFENLSKWYHFFNEYYNLLKKYGHCDRVYTSAEDYYNYESATKYSDQMIYGGNKQTYLDLDIEFADKGGRVEVLVFNKDTSEYSEMTPREAHDEFKDKPETDRLAMIDVYDVGFFKWVCDNVVPSFKIPKQYTYYWKRDVLFYPDVVKWLSWFSKRLGYEQYYVVGTSGEVDTWDCKQENVDCCDCEEYFSRGGKRVFDKLCEWFNGIQANILLNNDTISASSTCFIPTIITPTELQVSIDDLGKFSIFSKDYTLGEDYRTCDYGDSGNTHSGTVVTYNGKPMILESGFGFHFDDEYMEKYVSECNSCGYKGEFIGKCPKCGSDDTKSDFKSYTEHYISSGYNGCDYSGHINEFYSSAYTFYAYDENNVKYVSSKPSLEEAESDIRNQMAVKYPLTMSDFGWVLIKGDLYEVSQCEYGIYDKANKYIGGNKYIVGRDAYTNTPYTILNGKRIFAEFNEPTNEFYFPFFKKENLASDIVQSSISDKYQTFTRFGERTMMKYIEYNNHIYELSDSSTTVIIDGVEYSKVAAYTYYDNGNIIYVDGDGTKAFFYENDYIPFNYIETSEINLEEGYLTIPFDGDLTIYSVDEITGTTVSKLLGLRLYNVLTDDVGNTIEGVYVVDKEKFHQPPQGHKLEPLYQVGNTANISRFSMSESDEDKVGSVNYFVGDIITKMDFYYVDENDVIVKDTMVEISLEHSNDDLVTLNMYEWVKTDDDEYEKSPSSAFTPSSAFSCTTLSAITRTNDKKEEIISAQSESEYSGTYIVFKEDVRCDVTYNIGATLCRRKEDDEEGGMFGLCNLNQGVEYQENVSFITRNHEYYLKKAKKIENILPIMRNKVRNHSISYPITLYEMVQTPTLVTESQYDTYYEVPMAKFKTNINIFNENNKKGTYSKSKDMEYMNGMEVFPIYREEYELGSACIENIDSDIYIERGINSAFEKHLKLGEVTSLEALLQFGNGYFKIMES